MSDTRCPTKPDEAAFARAGSSTGGGLTKREYFAAAALTGWLADAGNEINHGMALECVRAADLLLEALNDEVPQ